MKVLLLVACIATTNIEALRYEIQKLCPAPNADQGHLAGVSMNGDERAAIWTWQYNVDMTGWEVGGTDLARAGGELATFTNDTVAKKFHTNRLTVRIADGLGSPVCEFYFENAPKSYSKSGKCVMYVEQAR